MELGHLKIEGVPADVWPGCRASNQTGAMQKTACFEVLSSREEVLCPGSLLCCK